MGAKSKAKYHGIPGDFEGQCEASTSNGLRRCKRHQKPGSNVCDRHGSKAPQVQQAARERLAALVPFAIGKLQKALAAQKNDPFISPQLQLAAARDILDRNGLKAKDEIVVRAEFDATRFADWSEADIEQFIALARRASTLNDATSPPLGEEE